MQMLAAETEVRHIFRPSLRYRGYSRFVSLFTVIYFAALVANETLLSSHHRWQEAIIGGLVSTLIYSGVTVAVSMQSTRLTVTADVFEFSMWGQGYWAYWTDVERVGRPSFPKSLWMGGEGLYLPRRPSGQVSLRSLRWYRRFIPLTWFAPDWRNSPLGDDIRQYAPWLMEG